MPCQLNWFSFQNHIYRNHGRWNVNILTCVFARINLHCDCSLSDPLSLLNRQRDVSIPTGCSLRPATQLALMAKAGRVALHANMFFKRNYNVQEDQTNKWINDKAKNVTYRFPSWLGRPVRTWHPPPLSLAKPEAAARAGRHRRGGWCGDGFGSCWAVWRPRPQPTCWWMNCRWTKLIWWTE